MESTVSNSRYMSAVLFIIMNSSADPNSLTKLGATMSENTAIAICWHSPYLIKMKTSELTGFILHWPYLKIFYTLMLSTLVNLIVKHYWGKYSWFWPGEGKQMNLLLTCTSTAILYEHRIWALQNLIRYNWTLQLDNALTWAHWLQIVFEMYDKGIALRQGKALEREQAAHDLCCVV